MYAEITGLRKELTEGRFYPPQGYFSRRDTEFETNSLLLHQNQIDIYYIYIRPQCVSGVASTGTFTKAASLIQGSETGQIPTGTSGIPEGWTVVNK